MNTAKKLTLGLLRGSGAAAFSPLDIAGLALWLDASDSTTLFQDSAGTTPAVSDGDVVGRWADKSGSGNHVTQATTGNKPLLKLAVQNGKNVVRFDGLDDYIDLAAFSVALSQPATHVFVCSFPGNKTLVDRVGAGTTDKQSFRTNGGVAQVYAGTLLSSAVATPIAVSIWTCVYNAASSSIARNGSSVASGDAGAQGMTKMSIGTRGDLSASFFYGGDISEILLFNAALSAANNTALNNYLNTKWAVF